MSQYAAAHADPQGPGDARPTALQIVKDEYMIEKLKDKIIVITGTSFGTGIEIARALTLTGASLFLTARDITKAKTALGDIVELDRIHLVEMDQNSLKSVRNAAEAILAKTNRVNVLINNAGVMGIPDLQLTEDGFEHHFGVNHLSHFLLFNLLRPALLAASTKDFASRVVAVSSAAHRLNGLNASDNYNFENGGYDKWVAYAQSKTANVYLANEIERRYGSRGLHATSVHPGATMTNLVQHVPLAETTAIVEQFPGIAKAFKSPEQGAATMVWAAIGKEWEGRGGKYLSDCSVAAPGPDDGDMSRPNCVSYTYDATSEGRLWKDSLRLVGLDDEE